jgi:4-hydroxybenzoate polyprenyltransferase
MFIAFCFAASAVYIVNDLVDVDVDKLHPAKCTRPLAVGSVNKTSAVILCVLLMIGAIVLSISINWKTCVVIIIYLLLNIAYSFYLKHIEIVDVFIIALGFVLRIYAGGFATDIVISKWLAVTALSFSLFLAFSKRFSEFKLQEEQDVEIRPSLRYYSVSFLSSCLSVSLVLSLIFYSFWCFTLDSSLAGSPMVFTIPFVLFILLKYMLILENENVSADPVIVIFNNKQLLLAVLVYAVLTVVILTLT